MRYTAYFVLALHGALLMCTAPACGQNDWMWRYTFDMNDQAYAQQKTAHVVVEKARIPHFSQLIFSWNAFRPKKGHYTFYVQVRDAHSKRWGTWHHALDWGKDVQRSYARTSDGLSSYAHVRLELDNGRFADAFRVKVVPVKGAHKQDVQLIAVTTADYRNFKPEHAVSVARSLHDIHVEDVPHMAQLALDHPDNYRMCSPTSLAMVVSFFNKYHHDPRALALQVYDTGLDAYGSWPFNTAHAYELCAGKVPFIATRLKGFKELTAYLARGVPVVVSIRGTLTGALKSFPHGHLLVVVGIDRTKRQVLCLDPARTQSEHVLSRYMLDEFLSVWEASRRLAYVAGVHEDSGSSAGVHEEKPKEKNRRIS